MARHTPSKPTRRQFLQQSATIAGAAAAASLLPKSYAAVPQAGGPSVALIVGRGDPIAESTEGQWAIHHLADALTTRNITVHILPPEADTSTANLTIIAGGFQSPFIRNYRINLTGPEALALTPVADAGPTRPTILATATDPRGLVYALTELADRATLASNPLQALQITERITEKPANPIRGIMRLFASDLEDKPWFYDRDFWPKYFDMLISNRFNRFNLALGLSYDFSTNLRDVYFFFAYPFFLDVPGHNVRAIDRNGNPISAEEQKKNLDTLRFISDQAALRGLDFQLGLWTHNYRWTNSPNATYTIDGLNPQTQAPYSRDAMHALIEACPGITGITLRTHGESGVPEGSYDLWKIIMAGITGHKTPDGKTRTIELDLHGKTMTQQMIDTAHTTNMPVTISCKFWAEHLGLPYIQSSIRETEMPKGRDATGLMALSSGTRSFLRYGVGDLLNKKRDYKVINRVWPGTQRLLLWGDPLYAAEYGRCSSFCGMDGIEYFDPLSFKGRAGSGLPPATPNAGRSGYNDPSLLPPGGGNNDWQKYLYTYRLLGRLSYNPDAKPETWQRQLQSEYGASAPHIESALASVSRILPLITTSHLPCAANFNYWPEIYVNMSLYDTTKVGSYGEVPNPKIFGNVSSLDPQIFCSIIEYADSILANKPLAKINPIQVAQQLEAWSKSAAVALANADTLDKDRPADAAATYHRANIDITIALGLGQFFAHKFRAGVLFTLFDRTGHEPARAAALEHYKKARDSWAKLADTAKVYAPDLPFGPDHQLRRHWSDRTADIDTDITGLQSRPANRRGTDYKPETVDAAIATVLNPPEYLRSKIQPLQPGTFKPNQPLTIAFPDTGNDIVSCRLCYRRVNQGERYVTVDMQRQNKQFAATIPADYTNSIFPLQYYFEIQTPSTITLYPGFKEDFTGQPYFVIQQSA